MPIIYAGNADAAPKIREVFARARPEIVDNLRPVLERREPRSRPRSIHDLFLEHVMAHAPGYDKLIGLGGRADHADARRGRRHPADASPNATASTPSASTSAARRPTSSASSTASSTARSARTSG
jgi:hypothetical protein